MLTNMTAEERERLAYAEGFTETANVLARIDDLEHTATVLLTALDLYAPKLCDEILGAMGKLREVLK